MTPLFSVEALPHASYTAPDITATAHALLLQAFDLIAATDDWPKGKLFNHNHPPTDGGPVQTRSRKSGQSGRAGKTAWHLRHSVHPLAPSGGLSYDDFRTGLLLDHAQNEALYIPSLVDTKDVEILKHDLASVILNSYKLPIVTADRDFLELLLTFDLPPHPAPFSPAHRAAIADPATAPTGINPAAPTSAADAGGLRSFLVVQVPVLHPDAPERKNYVRGAYASVEAVYEGSGASGPETQWKMAVQSDARGSIPLFVSESSLPGKIIEDVPLFVHWTRDRKNGKQDTTALTETS